MAQLYGNSYAVASAKARSYSHLMWAFTKEENKAIGGTVLWWSLCSVAHLCIENRAIVKTKLTKVLVFRA